MSRAVNPVTVRFEGGKEIDAALRELSKTSARNAVTRGLISAAKILVQAAEARAPHLTQALRRSINVSKRKPRDVTDVGKAVYRDLIRAGASRAAAGAAANAARRANSPDFAMVFVGPDRRPQGVLQEFGTAFAPAQPFMRPAWDAHKRAMLGLVVDAVRSEVKKSVDRARRKAARTAR